MELNRDLRFCEDLYMEPPDTSISFLYIYRYIYKYIYKYNRGIKEFHMQDITKTSGLYLVPELRNRIFKIFGQMWGWLS